MEVVLFDDYNKLLKIVKELEQKYNLPSMDVDKFTRFINMSENIYYDDEKMATFNIYDNYLFIVATDKELEATVLEKLKGRNYDLSSFKNEITFKEGYENGFFWLIKGKYYKN